MSNLPASLPVISTIAVIMYVAAHGICQTQELSTVEHTCRNGYDALLLTDTDTDTDA